MSWLCAPSQFSLRWCELSRTVGSGVRAGLAGVVVALPQIPTQHSLPFRDSRKVPGLCLLKLLGFLNSGPAALVTCKPPFLMSYEKGAALKGSIADSNDTDIMIDLCIVTTGCCIGIFWKQQSLQPSILRETSPWWFGVDGGAWLSCVTEFFPSAIFWDVMKS